ncbi:hypothetical protein I7I48_01600 [Histoplasma ohiense]|nr:hypothetical protein I7I48_01600 [Histoplasma ohiense (nom. inval.)]
MFAGSLRHWANRSSTVRRLSRVQRCVIRRNPKLIRNYSRPFLRTPYPLTPFAWRKSHVLLKIEAAVMTPPAADTTNTYV